MPTLARADLESLLRARKLDRTLTTVRPDAGPLDDQTVTATGIASLDARLNGGFPRGHLSELIGPASAGATTIMLAALAAATARGELVALVDALDTFDVESAAAAGIDLDRLLWIRGLVVTSPGLCRHVNQRAVEQAIKALSLVLQAGNFGVVVFDAAGAPPDALRRLPFTTWLRLHRMIEGTSTTCLLVANQPVARSSAGLTVMVGRVLSDPSNRVLSDPPHSRRRASQLFKGVDIEAHVVQSRVPRILNSEFQIPNCQASAHVRLHLSAAV